MGHWSLTEGLCLSVCVCSRELLELNPLEREKAALQYASWGPQGSQLVSQTLSHLPDQCVVCLCHLNQLYLSI